MKLDIKHYPLLLKIVCIIVLLPILAVPLVFYTSVFIFDHPSNILLAYAMFFGVNSYSLVLLGICWASVADIYQDKEKIIFHNTIYTARRIDIWCVLVCNGWSD